MRKLLIGRSIQGSTCAIANHPNFKTANFEKSFAPILKRTFILLFEKEEIARVICHHLHVIYVIARNCAVYLTILYIPGDHKRMSIDYGLLIVIAAVLVFYLRLIILQRQRAKQLKQQRGTRAGNNHKDTQQGINASYTVMSKNPLDKIIGAVGLILVVFGLLLYAGFLPLPEIQPYWWIPTALGIIGFSWVFRL